MGIILDLIFDFFSNLKKKKTNTTEQQANTSSLNKSNNYQSTITPNQNTTKALGPYDCLIKARELESDGEYIEAAQWYQKACIVGLPEALNGYERCTDPKMCFLAAQESEANKQYKRATDLYKVAAQGGIKDAEDGFIRCNNPYHIGNPYIKPSQRQHRGCGTMRIRLEEAIKDKQRKDFSDALEKLKDVFLSLDTITECIKTIHLIASADPCVVPDAQIWIGGFYESVEKNPQEAAKWFKIASDNGSAEGAYRYANMLMYGNGVEKDVEKADEYLKLSSERGYEQGKQFTFPDNDELTKIFEPLFKESNTSSHEQIDVVTSLAAATVNLPDMVRKTKDDSLICYNDVTSCDTILFACFVTRILCLNSSSSMEKAIEFSEKYVSNVVAFIQEKYPSIEPFFEEMFDNRMSFYDRMVEKTVDKQKIFKVLVEKFEYILKTDLLRNGYTEFGESSPLPIIGVPKDFEYSADVISFFNNMPSMLSPYLEETQNILSRVTS